METQEIPPPSPSVVNAQKDPLHKPHLTQSECRNNEPIIRVGQTVPATIDPALPAHVDIVGVSSDLDAGTLRITLDVRNIPATLPFNQIEEDVQEYFWGVYIDVDNNPSTGSQDEFTYGADYELSVQNFASGGMPQSAPLEAFVQRDVWEFEPDGGGFTIDEATLDVDRVSNTLTISGIVPNISTDARLVFEADDPTSFDRVGCIPNPIPTTPTPTSPPVTPTPTSPPVTPTPSATPTPIQVNTQINGGSGGEVVIPRDRRITVLLFVPPAALPNELFTVRYTGLPLLDLVLPNQQTMTGRFQTEAIGASSGTVLRTDRLLTMTVDLAPATPQLAQTTPLSPVVYARQGDAWVPAETRCIGMGCQQQVSGTRVTLLLDYVGEFAVGITPQRIYLPLIVRGQ